MKIYHRSNQHTERGLSERDRKEIAKYGIILKDAQRKQIEDNKKFMTTNKAMVAITTPRKLPILKIDCEILQVVRIVKTSPYGKI